MDSSRGLSLVLLLTVLRVRVRWPSSTGCHPGSGHLVICGAIATYRLSRLTWSSLDLKHWYMFCLPKVSLAFFPVF